MRFLVGEIERLGYKWAYRVVDSRAAGLPQRRRRVLLVASRDGEPCDVLFADDAGDRPDSDYRDDAYGFYWTEGRGGLGWAKDATPTLKGGSTVGIPSAPAMWVPGNPVGRKLIMPNIEEAEELQGFERGWTADADAGRRNGPRWKLIGNAVTTAMSEWLASRIASPGASVAESIPWSKRRAWPTAAWGEPGLPPQAVVISEFPMRRAYKHLTDVVDVDNAPALSHRAASGFWSRLQSGNLGQTEGFRDDVAEHCVKTGELDQLPLSI
jgi:DNA (cytosine-5)-methyltransferase 1